ncbi:hypothetical protein [Bradyrhizobium zhanjiangense]|uniref:hypothetical protein n=1 Tax=Bradyrhizobium zhanjiangense TaxID=1325107 RepID=UPI0013E8B1D9|nr:hypothetical protein [Bradyrhizobium zhanjiangense]
MTQLEPHPIEGDAYAEFLADIREKGVREPVSVFERSSSTAARRRDRHRLPDAQLLR